ncbi:aminotransferase class I/II-fold pyridoxal phosphate-dependent enzyme [Methylosinus sp. Sm6]|uniref:aminotransferase class I/II-fold pyridoxal phosphate-dependent enzyme n=1 Tax=Methylosinus sp. Sm6 TaxID=2866948 RepID=UPI001C9917DC|nr:aminotransferase class I/II-fold pyridoxal phosphate-dependent enzyme [Methylosinus sp. Sm6]
MLARRTHLFTNSGTARARAAAKAAAEAGRDVVDLTTGEIWSPLPPAVRDGAIAAIERGINRYTDTLGLAELRAALAHKLHVETQQAWRPDEIAVTSGAKQALFNAAMILIDPGDEVVIPSPYWTTFPAQVLIAGGTPVFVETRHRAFIPSIDDIERSLTSRTRALVVNTPNNPTGAVYPGELLAQIAELAIARDFWIIFDECYSSFVYESHVHHPIVSLVPEVRSRTLVVNAFSKALALTGWRIGYLAGSKEAIDAVRALQSHTTSNPNVIAQHAVLEHLRRNDASFESGLRSDLAAARRIGLEKLKRIPGIPTPRADGGFYFYLDVTSLLRTDGADPAPTIDDIVGRLVTEAGVAGVAGSAFGDPGGLRISYGGPRESFELGLDRLISAFETWDAAADLVM